MKNVGVLALQGAFREHIDYLKAASTPREHVNIVEVRTAGELEQCDALVIPGGESTAISRVAVGTGLLPYLYTFLNSGKPVWGTCAGLIFLARELVNGQPGQCILGGLDIAVRRNAFGRQIQSFEQSLDFSSFIPGLTSFPTVFIRAPVVEQLGVKSNSEQVIYTNNDHINPAPVEFLHRLESGLVVAVRQGNILGTSFHPELSGTTAFHQWFLDEFVLKK